MRRYVLFNLALCQLFWDSSEREALLGLVQPPEVKKKSTVCSLTLSHKILATFYKF